MECNTLLENYEPCSYFVVAVGFEDSCNFKETKVFVTGCHGYIFNISQLQILTMHVSRVPVIRKWGNSAKNTSAQI